MSGGVWGILYVGGRYECTGMMEGGVCCWWSAVFGEEFVYMELWV